jgi:ubiquinone/menaquinone biosynthesis C-methylase UbiE
MTDQSPIMEGGEQRSPTAFSPRSISLDAPGGAREVAFDDAGGTRPHGEPGIENIHRYIATAPLCAGKVVLDIACGGGYGSFLLSQTATHVYGVDIDAMTVAGAFRGYKRGNLEFHLGSCAEIPLPDNSVDRIVSFDTLEHFADHQAFLWEALRVLTPEGIMIVSTPDRGLARQDDAKAGERHPGELTEQEFRDFLGAGFQHVDIHRQGAGFYSWLWPADHPSGADADHLRLFARREKASEHIGYSSSPRQGSEMIALCSNGTAPPAIMSLFEGDGWPSGSPTLEARIAEREGTIAALGREIAEMRKRIEELTRDHSEAIPNSFSLAEPPRPVEPGEVDLAFGSCREWKDWLEANPWVVDQSHIQSVVEHAMTHGVEDGFLGFARPHQVSAGDANFRETLLAHGFNPRLRAVLAILGDMPITADPWTPRIYGSEALTPFALLLRQRFARYYGSEYAPTSEDQARIHPIPHQDITNLTLLDQGFDVIISNEVLEHVPDLDLAFKEAARVLAPGGVLIATFPFAYCSEETSIRAILRDGTIEHHAVPEYHGNPMDPAGGSLVFQVPGWDILPLAIRQGFESANIRFVSSKARAIIGAEIAGIFVLTAFKAKNQNE